MMHAVCGGVAGLGLVPAGNNPELTINPHAVLRGDPVSITVSGLEPGSHATIISKRRYGRDNTLYQTAATFAADEQGEIDPAEDRPIAAQWRDADPTGLFWAMRNTGEATPATWSRDEVYFALPADADGVADANAVLSMPPATDDLIEEPLGEDFPGAFVLKPASDERLPAVIILGGSEGGDSSARAVGPRFASRGYAAVGLPYYAGGIEGLPQAFANIPVDRLQDALELLRTRDDIDADRVGLWGVSKGAELALAASSRIDGFAAVVAIVPSDVIWEGWGLNDGTRPSSFAWRGEPLDYVPYLGMGTEFSKYNRDQKVAIRTPHDAGRLANPDRIATARIEVENIDEPVFLVGGDSDETWDSGGMARNIKETRDEAGLETMLFVDKRAGHFLSGDAYTPIRRQADADVRKQTFPAMLEFLEDHLEGGVR